MKPLSPMTCPVPRPHFGAKVVATGLDNLRQTRVQADKFVGVLQQLPGFEDDNDGVTLTLSFESRALPAKMAAATGQTHVETARATAARKMSPETAEQATVTHRLPIAYDLLVQHGAARQFVDVYRTLLALVERVRGAQAR